jgi:hypothetical protein
MNSLFSTSIRQINTFPYNPKAHLAYPLPPEISYVLDESGETIGFIEIGSPESVYRFSRLKWFRKDVLRALFDFSKQGGKFICIPRWPQFPSPELAGLFSIICYSSLEPESYLSKIPCINISKSDFTINVERFHPDPTIVKKYDILIPTWIGDTEHKGWDDIKKILPELQNYSILINSYKTFSSREVKWVKRFKNIEVTGHLSKDEYARKVQESKLALFPNRLDASPRVIPQCLACNVPVIVNKDIYGGLQYVTEKTGAAVPVKDFLKVIPELLRRYDQFQEARTFYLDNFGFYTTAHKLAQFVNKQFQTNYTLLYSEEDGYYKQFFTPPSLI